MQGQRNDEVYKECSACGGSSACKMPAEKITKYIIKDILENGVRRSYDKVEYDEFAVRFVFLILSLNSSV